MTKTVWKPGTIHHDVFTRDQVARSGYLRHDGKAERSDRRLDGDYQFRTGDDVYFRASVALFPRID